MVLVIRPSVSEYAWFSCEVRQAHAFKDIMPEEKAGFPGQIRIGIPDANPGAVPIMAAGRLRRSAWSASDFPRKKCLRVRPRFSLHR